MKMRWFMASHIPFSALPRQAFPGSSDNAIPVARFQFEGPVLPLVTDTLRVGEAFRYAAMSRFDAWCRARPPAQVQRFRRSDLPERYASPVLSGKDASGQYLTGHGHAYYLATDEDRD